MGNTIQPMVVIIASVVYTGRLRLFIETFNYATCIQQVNNNMFIA